MTETTKPADDLGDLQLALNEIHDTVRASSTDFAGFRCGGCGGCHRCGGCGGCGGCHRCEGCGGCFHCEGCHRCEGCGGCHKRPDDA